MSTTYMDDDTETLNTEQNDGGTDIKTLVEFARHYEHLQNLTGIWKFKHADITYSQFHSMRKNDLIEKADRSMGKAESWTTTRTADELLDRVTPIMAREIDSMSTKEVRILSRNTELISSGLPNDDEETFTASDVGMHGRTPEGLERYGFIEAETDRDGYANDWTITQRTKAVQEFLELYYE